MTSRIVAAALGAVLLLAGSPRGASAESLLWTLVASPLSATTGVSTTFVLTATNEDVLEPLDSSREIGCILLDVPVNFAVEAAAVAASSAGGSWTASVSGNRVRVRATSGGDRLELLDWVRFTVRATPTSSGQLAWNARAYRDQDCGGTGALLSVPPVVLVVGPAVTPTPAPTLAPTPLPTPSPTPTPTPKPTPTPTPRPVATADPTPRPSEQPTATVRATLGATPAASAATPVPSVGGPVSSAGARATETPTSSPAASRGATPAPQVDGPPPPGDDEDRASGPGAPADGLFTAIEGRGAEPAPVPIALGALGVLGSIDIWIVPGLLLGVPGLLVVAFVLLQTVGTLAWIPAIRRLRGAEGMATQ